MRLISHWMRHVSSSKYHEIRSHSGTMHLTAQWQQQAHQTGAGGRRPLWHCVRQRRRRRAAFERDPRHRPHQPHEGLRLQCLVCMMSQSLLSASTGMDRHACARHGNTIAGLWSSQEISMPCLCCSKPDGQATLACWSLLERMRGRQAAGGSSGSSSASASAANCAACMAATMHVSTHLKLQPGLPCDPAGI